MSLLLNRFMRFGNFAVIGGSVSVVGIGIQAVLVFAGTSVITAFIAQLVVTVLLNYELNRRFTWHDRSHGPTVAIFFYASRGITSAAALLVFLALIQLSGMHHLIANVITVAIITAINYFIGNRLIFRTPQASPQNEEKKLRFKVLHNALVAGALVAVVTLVMTQIPHLLLPIGLTLLIVYSVISVLLSMLNNHLFDYTSRTQEARSAIAFPPSRTDVKTDDLTGFSLILPGYNEEEVIGYTLELLAEQDYPHNKFEILVTLRHDDYDTLREARKVAARHPDIIRVFANVFSDDANKSTQMNAVFNEARYEYVAPIDAEDKVAPQLLRHMDALILRDGAHDKPVAAQGGVQLVNLDNKTCGSWISRMGHFIASGWFAVHNVMEYRTWFSSRMFFQQKLKFVPLGGNTIFIRTDVMKELGGWNDQRLTEDAHLGTILSVRGAKIVAAYTPELATLEHTPPRLFGSGSMFKQRVRWDQGFWQVLRDGEWKKLPTLKQRFIALYLLGTPIIQAFSGVMLPFAIFAALFMKAPLLVTMLLFLPFIPMMRTMVMQLMELNAFCSDFGLKAKPRHYASLAIGFFPYQFLLGMAAFAAVLRETCGINTWSKTARNKSIHGESTRLEPVFPEYALQKDGAA